ncbi:hypothetical protein BP5796_00150 [Coleophoma crateriformis]|uniref:Uncharacterized protein n=1 Tax=Coleophoma crateriformis TaxID=565419 RepID=A0A3D8T754_9HELO|nr:hypothetical protein BP5796_00150 [Coleophoma crateriformis]
MGGQAFALRSQPLFTPRMPLQIYAQILKSTLNALQQHFRHVASPIEAPGKATFGDVDILVAEPLNPDLDTTQRPTTEVAEALARILGAVDRIWQKGNPTINLALPWPSCEVSENENPDVTELAKKYIQVDVHMCPSTTSFTWTLFHAAHGDLWNILGTTIRPYGLTVNDHGLHLRIPEIELTNRNKSKIFLTGEPARVLSFLGLDESRWWTSFGSANELFEYAAGCRMFRVKLEGEEEDGIGAGDVVGEVEGQEGGEKGKKKLKHNDRQRMSKRPMFRLWIDEAIPKFRAEGRYSGETVSREQVREEAFTAFGIRTEYETRLKDHQLSQHLDETWRIAIKSTVPVVDVDPQFRAASVRTLKAVILGGDAFDGEVVPAAKTDENGFFDTERVREFVRGSWRKAGEIGMQQQQDKARKGMEAKAAKRKRASDDVDEKMTESLA